MFSWDAEVLGRLLSGMTSVDGWTGEGSRGDFCGRVGSSSDNDKRGGALSRFLIGISGNVLLGNCGSDPYSAEDGENIGQAVTGSC